MPKPLDPLLRTPQAAAALGVSPSLLHNMVKAGAFPKPIRITDRCIGWRASTVQHFIDAKEAEGYAPQRDRTRAATEARIQRQRMKRATQGQPEAA